MFGKLMKYELRYLIRIFAPMWAVVLSLCVLSRLVLRPDMEGMMYVEGTEAIIPVLVVMLAVFSILTMMIVSTVVLLMRFYKGMYGDEGYLMFTLPVTSGELIHSKALSAMIMMIGTELLTFAGVMVMISYPEVWGELGMTFREMFRMLLEMNGLNGLEFIVLSVWTIVVGLLSTAQGIYMVYLAISLGQLWKKHPVAGAIVAYYLMMSVLGVIQTLAGQLFGESALELLANLIGMDSSGNYGAIMAVVLMAMSVYAIILSVVSFVGTKLILDKKLNIQ